ncbi:hypothetical protein [uncultured Roseobacter sp.]|uniref:hypothetical protein n=1 Tax=uncultured Roseobacter sp. TaxID=114847 RepID=UPI0026055455|nr:hypothetical protein [uncultured Roseobacter sp.]
MRDSFYTPLISTAGFNLRAEIRTEVVTIRPPIGPILCKPTASFSSVRKRGGLLVLRHRRM